MFATPGWEFRSVDSLWGYQRWIRWMQLCLLYRAKLGSVLLRAVPNASNFDRACLQPTVAPPSPPLPRSQVRPEKCHCDILRVTDKKHRLSRYPQQNSNYQRAAIMNPEMVDRRMEQESEPKICKLGHLGSTKQDIPGHVVAGSGAIFDSHRSVDDLVELQSH